LSVEGLLEPDERVLLEVRESRWRAGGRVLFPERVVATDRRLIIAEPLGFGRYDFEVVWYTSISGVRLRRGILSCEVEVEAMGLTQGAAARREWGEAGIGLIQAVPCEEAEQLARACAVASGGRLACARSPMQGHEVRESVIRGSYSRALEMGDKIVGARERGKDLVEVLSHHFGFKEVFAGMVVEWVSRKAGAFLTGHLTITGEGVWKDRLMRIDFKNEYLVAFLDGLPYVTCPNLITVVDRETQKPLSNWANTYTYLHKSVSVLYKKAADVWHTRAGLTLFSPLHFGYSFGYTNAIDANAQ